MQFFSCVRKHCTKTRTRAFSLYHEHVLRKLRFNLVSSRLVCSCYYVRVMQFNSWVPYVACDQDGILGILLLSQEWGSKFFVDGACTKSASF